MISVVHKHDDVQSKGGGEKSKYDVKIVHAGRRSEMLHQENIDSVAPGSKPSDLMLHFSSWLSDCQFKCLGRLDGDRKSSSGFVDKFNSLGLLGRIVVNINHGVKISR